MLQLMFRELLPPQVCLTQFLCQAICTQRPEGTQVIVGSMNMEYISDTARNRTHNLFRPKRDGLVCLALNSFFTPIPTENNLEDKNTGYDDDDDYINTMVTTMIEVTATKYRGDWPILLIDRSDVDLVGMVDLRGYFRLVEIVIININNIDNIINK